MKEKRTYSSGENDGLATVRIDLERKHTYWGEPLRWRYGRDSLKAALLRDCRRGGSLFDALCKGIDIAPGKLAAVDLAHFQEGEFQIILKAGLRGRGQKPRTLCMVLAKDGGTSSRVSRREYGNLLELHDRQPGIAVRPLSEGTLAVGTGPRAKRVHWYLAPWLKGYHELGVDQNMRFFINERPFHSFGIHETDWLKKEILRTCLLLYDPYTGSAIDPPLIGAGDFVVTRPERGRRPALRLIACRRIRRGLSLERCADVYLGYAGEWGGRIFTFLPSTRDLLWQGMCESLVDRHGLDADRVRAAMETGLARHAPALLERRNRNERKRHGREDSRETRRDPGHASGGRRRSGGRRY